MNHGDVWRLHAACRGTDPDRFFLTRGDIEGTRSAKAVCRGCPVRVDCLLEALERREEFGLWGGAGEPVRRALLTLERKHYGFDPECPCQFCRAVADHLAHLDGQGSSPFISTGQGARHGRAATYGRGCRCDPCSLAKTMQTLVSSCRRRARKLAS